MILEDCFTGYGQERRKRVDLLEGKLARMYLTAGFDAVLENHEPERQFWCRG